MILRKLTTIILAVGLVLVFSQQAAIAQDEAKREQIKIEITELEKAVQLLENPEEAKRVAAQLKALLTAKQELAEEKKEPKKPEKKVPVNLFKAYESYERYALSAFAKLTSEIQELPLSYQQVKAYLSEKENRQRILSFGIKFFIALVLGLIVWMVFRTLTKRVEKRIKLEEPLTLGRRFGHAFIVTAFRMYPWIGLYLFFYILFLIVPIRETLRLLILWEIFALFFYSVLKQFVYSLVAPDAPPQRVIPMKDETAHYIFVWWRRILLFSLWVYVLIIPGYIFDRPVLAAALSTMHKVGVVVMAGIILAQWKEGIEKVLSLRIKAEDPYWKNNIKKIFNFIMGKLYLITIIYLGIIVILPVVGLSHIYTYLLYATAKSIIVIIVAAGFWFLWNLLFNKLFEVSAPIKERYPELEEQVNRYVGLLGKAGHIVILVFGFLTILDMWGLRAYEFVASNSAVVQAIIRIPLIALGAMVLFELSKFLVKRLEKEAMDRMLATRKMPELEAEKRAVTFGRIFRKIIGIAIITVTAMMIFAEVGFDIKPILAGAGILGLAVGFGAQNLVRDIISGLFLIVENRIRVNDVAIINGTGGLVEQVNLRTTVLRGLDGVVHVFPNGAINTLSNMTHEFSFYIFDVGVAYKEDVDRVIAVLKELGEEMTQDQEYAPLILEPLEIMGVDQFADSAVVIKARFKTLPIKQWVVGREMNRRIKKRFDELGIEIPFPHRTFYFGEASKPVDLTLEGLKEHREDLKQMIREVLQDFKPKGLNQEG
ncbi:MAG: mechanosensitive ion channel domain-containing protein [Pseudomonadota bacterium]